jgi:hypothetical protein
LSMGSGHRKFLLRRKGVALTEHGRFGRRSRFGGSSSEVSPDQLNRP